MSDKQQTVFLVDDDQSIRRSVTRALDKRGLKVESFESSEIFLKLYDPDQRGCLLLDLSMPGMDGLELQRELVNRGADIPIIFVTGHGGVPESVQALKAGAIDFLEKPFLQDVLLERIHEAFTEDERRRAFAETANKIKARFEMLTKREHDVARLLISGSATLSSKQVAKALDISPRTVDHHRARVMEKTQARSVAELVNLANLAGITGFGSDS